MNIVQLAHLLLPNTVTSIKYNLGRILAQLGKPKVCSTFLAHSDFDLKRSSEWLS